MACSRRQIDWDQHDLAIFKRWELSYLLRHSRACDIIPPPQVREHIVHCFHLAKAALGRCLRSFVFTLFVCDSITALITLFVVVGTTAVVVVAIDVVVTGAIVVAGVVDVVAVVVEVVDASVVTLFFTFSSSSRFKTVKTSFSIGFFFFSLPTFSSFVRNLVFGRIENGFSLSLAAVDCRSDGKTQ